MADFQNGSVVVELANNANAIFLRWKGSVPSLEYREGLERSLEIARKHNIKNWISDIRLLNGISLKDQRWVSVEWLPKAVSAGCYKNQAVIVAEYPFEKPSELNTITTIQNETVEIQHFTNPEDAKQWLENKV